MKCPDLVLRRQGMARRVRISAGQPYPLFFRPALLGTPAWPNDLAVGRLETYTGIPRTLLARALRWKAPPSPKPLPADRPALYFRRTDPRARSGCRHCELAASGPDGPAVLRLPGWTPLICRRHRRWTGYGHETSQHDLSAAPDILAAGRRRMRLLARSDNWQWTARIFQAARSMTQDRTKANPRRMPVFSQRWRDRAATLGITISTTDKWSSRPRW